MNIEISEISESLGQGSYGGIYPTDNPNIVEKIFNNENDLHTFYHECAAYQVLSPHESLPQIYKIENTSLKKSIHIERFDTNLRKFLKERKLIVENLATKANLATGPNLTPETNLTPEEIKLIAFQLLNGVHHAHSRGICHGDLKPQNILINRATLKVVICDWGSSQYMNPLNREYGPEILTTLWYKAPEILLGCGWGRYDTAVDMWCVGLILAELVTGQALFKGDDDTTQLDKIYKVLDNPGENNWLAIDKTKYKSKAKMSTPLYTIVNCDSLLENLLTELIVLNPLDRIAAWQGLNNDYFKSIRIVPYCSYSTHKTYDIIINYYPVRDFYPHKSKDFIFNIYREEDFSDKLILLAGCYIDLYISRTEENKMNDKVALVCLNLAKLILQDHPLDLEDMQTYLTITKEEFDEISREICTVLKHDLYTATEFDHLLMAGRGLSDTDFNSLASKLIKFSFKASGIYPYDFLIQYTN